MRSDWPVTTPDPTAAIHLAVNRSLPDDDAPARNPSEAIGLNEALTAYTSGGRG
ncbi:MAG: amidohydrolase [Amycolatopsis sp.]|jgi:predicted amidohydrolase YtcJ|uniref:hypothetical protein n=1 Tax=Amycolatopsis sp. TaxID=37632 RepID=UPI002621F76B|nr:hypothetical protein [Amycolatopsis sp.]MCU1681087.1 amidohydrolase [Amycolatopsis sp.]